jgi:predicted RNA-binding protein with EMAP domain
MILPNFVLTSRQNQIWTESGMDSYDFCFNKKHYESYALPVEYRYNSRGFRDTEWPNTVEELRDAIWCVGDSFTVGIGSAANNTWPVILQKQIATRVINISMDGASNDWIARKTVDILTRINPKCIILHWSYLERREISQQEIWKNEADKVWKELYAMFRKKDWPDCNTVAESKNLPDDIQKEISIHWVDPYYTDEERRRTDTQSTLAENLQNLRDCIIKVNNAADHTKIIHSFIPEFSSGNNGDLQGIIDNIKSELKINIIDYFPKFDRARDYHHYDIKTARYFVDKLIKLI